jgi:hypothetical protein
VLGGAYQPTVFVGHDGTFRARLRSFYRQRYGLIWKTRRARRAAGGAQSPAGRRRLPPGRALHPAIGSRSTRTSSRASRRKALHRQRVSRGCGVYSDGTFFSATLIFSDNLGDRRAIFNLQSVSSYTQIRLSYFNLKNRLQIGGTLFDDRQYFIGTSTNPSTGFTTRGRQFFRQTGGLGLATYPLDRYHRIEGSLGVVSRSLDVPYVITNADGTQAVFFVPRDDTNPTGAISFTGDTSLYSAVGPLAGHRYTFGYSYTPDLKGTDEVVGTDGNGDPIVAVHGGTLTQTASFEFRQYFRLTKRSVLAFRLLGIYSSGNSPDISAIGGADTLRAYDYNAVIGNRIGLFNGEYRFPLIDQIRMFGGFGLSNIRGKFFIDVGAAQLTYGKPSLPFKFWNGSSDEIVYRGVTYSRGAHPVSRTSVSGFSLDLLGCLSTGISRSSGTSDTLSGFKTSFCRHGVLTAARRQRPASAALMFRIEFRGLTDPAAGG